MKYIYFYLIFLTIGCTVQFSKLTGVYFYKNSETSIRLNINNDSTFSIRRNDLGVINTCMGKVFVLEKNKIRLICINDKSKPVELLKSNFYEFKEVGVIINSHTLKIGNTILKKTNN